MKPIVARLGILIAVGVTLIVLSNLGIIDTLVASTGGLVFYWVVVMSVFGVLVFGVVRPFLIHLHGQDTFFARLMTNRLMSRKR